jgi:hypothetical protein
VDLQVWKPHRQSFLQAVFTRSEARIFDPDYFPETKPTDYSKVYPMVKLSPQPHLSVTFGLMN